jgi:nucleoside-diphosphate-sugar epimerase
MSTASGTQPTVLITGSEGLIGDALVNDLSSNYDIASFDIARPHKLPEVQDFMHCDLTQDESVQAALETLRQRHGNHLASVIHLAAYYDFSGEPSPLYRELTVEGTRRLLRGLQNFEVDQFVFSSTLLVMKPAEKGELVRETSPTDPGWDYPVSKLETEGVIEQERGNIRSVILRIAGVYDDIGHSPPITQQISRIYEKELESYFFPGDADKGQSFIHLEDMVTCLRRVIERRHELAEHEVFLIGEPDMMSYEELQDQLGELIHEQEWPTLRVPKLVAKAGAWVKDQLAGEDGEEFIKPWMIDLADQNYPVSMEKAREKLGWEPKRRLRNTLSTIVGSLLSNPQKWYEENGISVPESVKT